MAESSQAIELAARYIDSNAERVVSTWIDWVQDRVQTPTIGSLPAKALRNHIPPILRCLANYVREPVLLSRQELLDNLRLHAEVRRDQGYSLQEVLAELDGLSDIVMRGVAMAIVQAGDGETIAGALQAATRVATGLRTISYVAMGAYSESDEARHHDIAASLEEFARAVSHELRNPLNTIALNLQIMREEFSDNEKLIGQLDVMEGSLRTSAYLLDTMRTLTVAESARAGRRLISLEEALTTIEREFGDQAQESGVEIRVERPLPQLFAESIVLHISLANTVGNAIKYADTSKETSRVTISVREIAEEDDTGFCEIEVRDNGLGISEEFLPHIFQKGFRAHSDRAQGSGYGLALVQQAVTSRGGTISVASNEGEGTTFTITIRCLARESGGLSAEHFRVEHLMGEALSTEASSYPEPPPLMSSSG